jgi:hypothetical protein
MLTAAMNAHTNESCRGYDTNHYTRNLTQIGTQLATIV